VTVYCYYRYVKQQPSIARLLLVGLAGGLALATKHTGILIFPILLALAICEWLLTPRATPEPSERKRLGLLGHGGSLTAITAISLVVLWGSYGFRYAARPAGLQLNPTSADYIAQLSRPREAKLLVTVARYHLLPESYIYGLADVRLMDDFYSTFLLGKAYPHGVWFYFPFAIAIKSTLAFLALLAIAIWAIAAGKLTRWREILFLTVPPGLYLAVAMSFAHEHRGTTRTADLCLSSGTNRRPSHGAHQQATSLDLRLRRPDPLPDGHVAARLPNLHPLRQRGVGWTEERVVVAKRLQRRLGAAAQSHQAVAGRARGEGLLVCLLR